MKKLLLILAAAAAMTGCGGSTQASSRAGASSQNTVDSVLQAGIEQSEQSAAESQVLSAADEISASKSEEGKASETSDTPADAAVSGDIVDLTVLDGNMVYSEVFAMMSEPEQYMGKTVKMNGRCDKYTDPDTGKDYYACIIKDAAACCAQGIEFQLSEDRSYPESGEEITVTGTFGTYTEGGNKYLVLLDSDLI